MSTEALRSDEMKTVTSVGWGMDCLVDALLLGAFIVLVIIYLYQRWGKASYTPGAGGRLPPGPWGLPVFGYLPFLNPRRPYETFCQLRKRYGDVFSLKMGSHTVVVLNGKKVMRESLLRQSEAFAGRPAFKTLQAHCEGRSLGFGTYSQQWRLHSKLAAQAIMKVLRHPDNVLQSCTNAVSERIIDSLLEHGSVNPVNPTAYMKCTAYDIILNFCFGKDARYDSDRLCKMMIDTLRELVSNRKTVQAVDILPWTTPFLYGRLKDFNSIQARFTELTEQKIQETLEQAKGSEQDQEGFRTAVQALDAMFKTKSEQMEDIGLTRRHLLHSVEDFIGASADTMGNFPRWMLLYMCYFPEVQRQVQEEVDQVLGRGGRSPTDDDRSKMPYTEAVMLEIARHSGLMPMSIPHSTVKDVKVAGYTIPKNTMVFAHFYSQAHDPELWTDPETFNPHHFLTQDGCLDKAKVEQFPMFGYGKRRCLGERIGNTASFLIFVNLMRRLSVRAAPGVDLPPIGSGSMDITMEPDMYKVMVEDRALRRSHAG